MTLNEVIKELTTYQLKGYGDLQVCDFSFQPIECLRKSINVDYNTGDETDIIIIE